MCFKLGADHFLWWCPCAQRKVHREVFFPGCCMLCRPASPVPVCLSTVNYPKKVKVQKYILKKWKINGFPTSNMTGLYRALTSTPSNTSEMNWNADWEPDNITHHQCWTSLILLWLNGSKCLQPGSNIWWKKMKLIEWRLVKQHIIAYGTTCLIITYDLPVSHTFLHIL